MKYFGIGLAAITVRRSPQGECGLKLHVLDRRAERFGRSPQGECGLKFPFEGEVCHAWRVAPRKGSVD